MKKILSFMVIFLLSSLFYLKVNAAGLQFSKGEFTTNEIANGVFHTHSSSTVMNDIGSSSKQNVNVVVKQHDASNVQVVSWTKFTSTGAWTFGTVEDLARDFESKNPGYSVIAGVNGDYFAYSPSRTINANMNLDGDIIKASNHSKYFSVGINSNGDELVVNKTTDFGSTYFLTVYDSISNEILHVVKLKGLNSRELMNDETTVYYNSTTENLPLNETNKFVVRTPIRLSYMDSHLLGKGQITDVTSSDITVSDKEFAVVTKDQSLKQLLELKPIVRVQKLVSGNYLNSKTVIGADSQILKDGNLRSFVEIGGQSFSNTSTKHPRTSFGITEDGSFIIATVDGRQATGDAGVYSNGVDLRELATIMKSYGAYQAFNLDGGGSSQLVVKNENGELVTVNSPSEGPHFPVGHSYYKSAYRSTANALLFVIPDINVQAKYTNITGSSLTLNYQINPTTDVNIEQSKLVVNGLEQSLNTLNGEINLTNLIEDGLNIINFKFSYQKNGMSFSKVFESKIIDLSADSGNRERAQPSNFTVNFSDIEDTKNFNVKVCFVDVDNIVTKISVLRLDINLNLNAIRESDGCYSIPILNATENTTYEFNIKYFYDENRESKVLDTTYRYTYKPGSVDPIEPANFSVDYINIQDTNDFKVKVCYEDVDQIITNLSVILKDNNEELVAVQETDGCYYATIKNATKNTKYNFSIKYYFNENNDSKILDNNDHYIYQPVNTDPNNETTNSDMNYSLISIVGGLILVGIGAVVFFISKKKI